MANTKLDNLFTPGGRLVMGSLTEKGDKDQAGVAIPPDKQAYFFGVAVPKTTPGVMELINQLWTLAATDYARVPLVMAQINMGLAAPGFSWKIQDGDVATFDPKTGQVRETPEYLKGCYIFKFRTMFEISACNAQGMDIARSGIKRGDYVDVMFSSSINEKVDGTAGIYLNPNAIRLLGYGDAITSGITASNAFAGRGAALPTGATSMPTASGALPGAGMPGSAPPPPPAVAAPFPPAGWAAHPSAPGYFYAGQEVLTEADLRARFPLAPSVPAPPPMAPAVGPVGMPGALAPTASPFSGVPHTAILTPPVGMPGMPR